MENLKITSQDVKTLNVKFENEEQTPKEHISRAKQIKVINEGVKSFNC